jgi:hypothetical protein
MHYRIMVRDLGTGDIVVRSLLEVEVQSDLPTGTFIRWGEMIEETFKMANYGSQGDKASNEVVQEAITSLNTVAVHTYKSVMRSKMTLVEISERISRIDNEIVAIIAAVQENHILMK